MLFAKPFARWCAACTALFSAPCLAQTEDTDPFHWAYAASLGSGVYALGDGGETQTYRANFSWSLRDAEVWFVEFDAVGVAYRFSENGEGFRLYFNSAF